MLFRSPSQRKAPFSLKSVKIKKIVASKSLAKKKILRVGKPKALNFFSKTKKPSQKVAKPSLAPIKLVKPPKAVLKTPKPLKPAKPQALKETLAGEIVHFFDKIQVCVVKLACDLKVGDQLHFKGKGTDFVQALDSMQINHQQVMMAKKGHEIGLKVKKEVRVGDKVFLSLSQRV